MDYGALDLSSYQKLDGAKMGPKICIRNFNVAIYLHFPPEGDYLRAMCRSTPLFLQLSDGNAFLRILRNLIPWE